VAGTNSIPDHARNGPGTGSCGRTTKATHCSTGSGCQAKNKYERAFAEQGKAINDKVRLYAKVGAALVSAREQGRDPYLAIEAIVS
jgi:hypothetical protein